MEATALSTALSTALQADYRQLITDSKRGDTISSQISGLFSAPDSPAVKEAAERAILKIRSFSSQNFWTKIRESPVSWPGTSNLCAPANACMILAAQLPCERIRVPQTPRRFPLPRASPG